MREKHWLSFIFILLLVGGCSSESEPGTNVITSFDNYEETGDMPALRERGVVRLLAPRFDEPSALPREGIPTTAYQHQAEDFIKSLGLTPKWVYADNYGELDDLLLAGKADIIVSNYSVTRSRKEQVAFSTSVNSVQERLVLPPEKAQTPLKDLGATTLSVPAGAAYEETAEKLAARHPDLTVNIIQEDLSDAQLVDGVASGRFAASIVDDNMLASLIQDRNDVVAGPVVNRKRRIAWAVRPDNPKLLATINNHITSERVVTSSQNKKEKRDWQAIKEDGVLRVITSNNPASYFMWRGELMGFDYDLIRHFAKKHGLRVSVVVRHSPSAMFASLQAGEGDLIAASMTDTQDRREQGWVFSDRYLEINEQLIGREGAAVLDSDAQLAGKTVAVNPETAYLDTLEQLQEEGIEVNIQPVEGASTEMLINGVDKGDYPLTMADSHLAAMESTYLDDIKVLHDFQPSKSIAWGLRPGQETLKGKLDGFIKREYKGLFYNVTFNRYFREKKTIASHKANRVRPGEALSPYDATVQQEALKYGLDWRLVTSQMYQESRFNPNARSFAGAQGLLQVMPRTGRQFGYSNLTDPDTGLEAGMAYMDWLEQRFPARLDLGEKLYFTLAAYNAGHGHVEDARRLAEQLGKDPDRWFDNVEDAMLLLAKPEYARQARYGYVRGSEPVKYVRQIKNRYLAYIAALEEQEG